jgi:hypothetical protein
MEGRKLAPAELDVWSFRQRSASRTAEGFSRKHSYPWLARPSTRMVKIQPHPELRIGTQNLVSGLRKEDTSYAAADLFMTALASFSAALARNCEPTLTTSRPH